jgi:hypothetical protein
MMAVISGGQAHGCAFFFSHPEAEFRSRQASDVAPEKFATNAALTPQRGTAT